MLIAGVEYETEEDRDVARRKRELIEAGKSPEDAKRLADQWRGQQRVLSMYDQDQARFQRTRR